MHDSEVSFFTPGRFGRSVQRALAAMLAASLATAAWAQPANNHFADAEIISGMEGVVIGRSLGATKEPGEPNHAGDAGGASVWYRWTAPTNATMVFETFGSTFDTLLAVYTGDAMRDLSGFDLALVVLNEETVIPAEGTNLVIVARDEADRLLFRIFDAEGAMVVDLSEEAFVARSSELAAIRLMLEPLWEGEPGDLEKRPVINAIASLTGYQLDLIAENDAADPFALDFSSRVTFQAVAGAVYHIAVDGHSGAHGDIVMAWRQMIWAGHFLFSLPEYFGTANELVRVTVVRRGNATGRVLVDVGRLGGGPLGQQPPWEATLVATLLFDDYQMSQTFFASVGFLGGSPVGLLGDQAGYFVIMNAYPDVAAGESPDLAPTFDAYIPPGYLDQFVPEDPENPTEPWVRFDPNDLFAQHFPLATLGLHGRLLYTGAGPLARVIAHAALPLPEEGPFEGEPGAGVIQFAAAHYMVSEHSGTVQIQVQRIGGAIGQQVTVDYWINFEPQNFVNRNNYFPLMTGSDYAEPNVDYTPPGGGRQTLTFGANQATANISIPILHNPTVDLNKDIYIELIASANPRSPSVEYRPPEFEIPEPEEPEEPEEGEEPPPPPPPPEPVQTRAASGYRLGSQTWANVTILFNGFIGDEQPAGAVDRTHNRENFFQSDPPLNVNPGANRPVYAIAIQADDRTLLAGEFTAVNNHGRGRIARLLPNGQIDRSFDHSLGANNFVNAIRVQPDGRILIGGGFSSYDAVARNGIARLMPDGSLDPSFNPGTGVNAGQAANHAVENVILQPDGRIIVVGNFTMFNSVPRNRIARLNSDGTLDSSFNVGAGPNGIVFASAVQADGRILIAGAFTSVSGVARSRIARLNADGTVDSTFNPGTGADAEIYTLLRQADGGILIGGAFTKVNEVSRRGVARLLPSGTVDAAFDPGTGADNSVFTMALQADGRILIGGLFRSFNGTRRVGVARLLSEGILDTSFMDTAYNQFAGLVNPVSTLPPNYCLAIAVENSGNVLIGGAFQRVGGGGTRAAVLPRLNIARLIGGETPGPGHFEFTQENYDVDESNGQRFIQVRRGNNGWLGEATMLIRTTDGTAVRDQDYLGLGETFGLGADWATWTSTRRTFGNGQTRKVSHARFGLNNNPDTILGNTSGSTDAQVWLPIIDNAIPDGDRSFQIHLDLPRLDTLRGGFVEFGGVIISDSRVNVGPVFNLGGDPLMSDRRFFFGLGEAPQGEPIPIGTALGRSTATVTIIDNDALPGEFAFSSDEYVVNENAGTVTITVRREKGSSGPVSVWYQTLSGTAIPGADFTFQQSQLQFNAGVTERTFTVPIVNDPAVKDDRFFNVRLFNPAGGATLGEPTIARVTIIDNSYAPGRLNFSSDTYSASEGASGAVVTVTRVGGSLGTLLVHYETSNGTGVAGVDYTPVQGTLSWNSGDSMPKTFVVPLIDNQLVEPSKTVNVRLYDVRVNTTPDSQALGARSTAVVTILDDDAHGVFSFVSQNFRVNENGGHGLITVVRTGGTAESVSVNYATSDVTASAGLDYAPASGTLLFGPGQLSQTFLVPILDNTLQDGDRWLALTLSNPNPANSAGLGEWPAAILTILDNESAREPAGSLDTLYNASAGANDFIYSIVLEPQSENLLAAGDFTMAGDLPRSRIARFMYDGRVDAGFPPVMASGANDSVRAMSGQSNGRFMVGGLFNRLNSIPRNHIGRLHFDGTLDTTFNPGAGANSPVLAIAEAFVRDNLFTTDKTSATRRLLAGGSFTSIDGLERSGIVRLHDDGSVDISFHAGSGVNGVVYAIAVQPSDGRIVIGGDFIQVHGTPRRNLARLNVDGTLDLSFDAGTGPNGAVRTVVVQPDGRLLVGGSFTSVNGVARGRLARLGRDGAVESDSEFRIGDGANDTVFCIVLQPNGRILVGGDFTRAQGVTRNRITRLNPDGTMDPTINFGLGANSIVNSITLESQGKILLAGGFTEFDGQPRNRLARLHAGSMAGVGRFEFLSSAFTATKNGSDAVITVRRIEGTSGTNVPVSVQVIVTGGTAAAGSDYAFTSTNLVFAAGEVLRSFHIPIINNFLLEEDKTVHLELANATGGAGIANQTSAILTIIEDNSAFTLSSAEYRVSKNISTREALITVRRLGGVSGAASIDFATRPGTAVPEFHYMPTNGTLVFGNGESTAQFAIQIIDNTVIEGDKTVQIDLLNPTGAILLEPRTAVLTIVDSNFGAGTLGFAQTSYSVVEGTGPAVITLLRSNGSSGLVSVDYATSDGTGSAGDHYIATQGTVVFGDGELSKTFSIPIVNDSIVNFDRTVVLTLSNPQGGASITAPESVSLTIHDDDLVVRFSSPVYFVNEADGSATITVLRAHNLGGTVSVDYSTVDGTAVAGVDYSFRSGRLVFAPGETIKVFSVPVMNDSVVNGDRTVTLRLSNPSAGAQIPEATATLTIIDNDTGFRLAQDEYVVEENGGFVTVTVVRETGIPGVASVRYATSDGTATAGVDYVSASGTLVFPDGVAARTFDIQIVDNSRMTGDQSFFVELFEPSPGAHVVPPSIATVTVVDNDAGLHFSSTEYFVREDGVEAVITVGRTNILDTVVAVSFATSDGTAVAGRDYVSTNGTLLFLPGEVSKSFGVRVIDNTLEDGDRTVVLRLSDAGGNATLIDPNAATLTIIDTDGSTVIVPAGAALISESLLPANGSIDPGETVQIWLALRNASSVSALIEDRATENLVGTLQASDGISSPSGPQNYGVLTPNGASISRPFTFTAMGTNGARITATLRLQDGDDDLGSVTFAYTLGTTAATFANPGLITIRDKSSNLPSAPPGLGEPYPSIISVSGVGGAVTRLTATLSGLHHRWPSDVDMLLVGPAGQRAILMSDVGGGNMITNVSLNFDDSATAVLSADSRIESGTYRPTNIDTADHFPSPAPPGPYPASLAGFNNTNPNGNWSLFVTDDTFLDGGHIAGGWSLSLTTLSPVPAAADLAVEMIPPASGFIIGEELTYTIVVANHGPSSASNVMVTNTVPQNSTFIAASAGHTVQNGEVIWNLGSLAKDATRALSVRFIPTVAGSITNRIAVQSAIHDPNSGNNSIVSVRTVMPPTADLAVALSDAPDPVVRGELVTYTIVVTNQGPATAREVTLTNSLPPGVVVVQSSLGCAPASQDRLICAIGDIVPNGSVTYQVVVRATLAGTNTVIARVGSVTEDPFKANNVASIKTVVEPAATDPGAAPSLSAHFEGALLVIVWASSESYVLETATALGGGWSPVTGAEPQLESGLWRVTINSLESQTRFFRLRRL